MITGGSTKGDAFMLVMNAILDSNVGRIPRFDRVAISCVFGDPLNLRSWSGAPANLASARERPWRFRRRHPSGHEPYSPNEVWPRPTGSTLTTSRPSHYVPSPEAALATDHLIDDIGGRSRRGRAILLRRMRSACSVNWQCWSCWFACPSRSGWRPAAVRCRWALSSPRLLRPRVPPLSPLPPWGHFAMAFSPMRGRRRSAPCWSAPAGWSPSGLP